MKRKTYILAVLAVLCIVSCARRSSSEATGTDEDEVFVEEVDDAVADGIPGNLILDGPGATQ